MLAALPLVVGTLHASPPRSTGVTASAHEAAGHTGPQWLSTLGMSWDSAWAIGETIGCGWSAFDIAMWRPAAKSPVVPRRAKRAA